MEGVQFYITSVSVAHETEDESLYEFSGASRLHKKVRLPWPHMLSPNS